MYVKYTIHGAFGSPFSRKSIYSWVKDGICAHFDPRFTLASLWAAGLHLRWFIMFLRVFTVGESHIVGPHDLIVLILG